MAETVEGGRYRVGDQWQNANGKEVSGPSGASAPETGDALDGVDFASEAAREAAMEAELSSDAFKGASPSSANGYTKPDVQALIEAKAD